MRTTREEQVVGNGAEEVVIPAGPGEAHVLIDRPPGAPQFLLALTHGAGGGVETADLLAVRDAALAAGGVVARILQPYRVRGARVPGSPARQDAEWVSTVAAVRALLGEDGGVHYSGRAGPGAVPLVPGTATVPLLQGGRSNGARVACRTAGRAGARAVIALAFPLHPPGRPEFSRREELRMATAAGASVLVINGSRDPFGVPGPADTGGGPDMGDVVVLEGEGHALSRDPGAAGAAVSSWLAGWLGAPAASRAAAGKVPRS